MSASITELMFLNQLAARFKVPVPGHLEGPSNRRQIKDTLARWDGKAVAKADVLAGKRGKGGAAVEVSDAQEAMRALRQLAASEVQDQQARSSYLTEFIPADLEVYSAITYDSRFLGPAFTLSMQGGMDIEDVPAEKKRTIAVDVYKGLDAYQASELLSELGCPAKAISPLSRALVNFWDMFITIGMRMAEVNPWRVRPDGQPFACDFKGMLDDTNFKAKDSGLVFPEYPEAVSEFEEEMTAWSAASHQGQAHVSDLGGHGILPILFGGGASAIITETLEAFGGDPIMLSDFGGNPPYERMLGTARICFKHRLGDASLLLILGGKANNTLIDVTFKALADALVEYCDEHGPLKIPVVIGRGGPRMVAGFITMRNTLDELGVPYVVFGHDTPITLVAEYAARLASSLKQAEGSGSES